MTAKFCQECGSPVHGASLQVAHAQHVDLTENRSLVTVLFADLSGSTSLAEQLDPEDLRAILSSFFSVLSREIQRYGGTVDKYIGDAVMAVFGAPVAHEDDAERAINAAMAMHAAIAELNEDLERKHATRLALRIGINTGEVVAGLLGGEAQGAYTVVGDTVNTAQRFESAADPGTILVSQSTRDLTRQVIDFEELEPLTLKGKAERHAAFKVLGARFELANPSEVPLVGRKSELRRLRSALDAALSGKGAFLHLVGEAGVGKSRLIRELRARLPEDIQQVVGRCVSFEAERPYALLARLLRDIVRVPSGQNESGARAAIEGVLEVMGPINSLDTSLLLEVLGYGERSAIDPASRQGALRRLLCRLLTAYTERGPLLIVAEDLHWADPASVALLTEFARDIPSCRCLLLSTARSGQEPPASAEVVRLEALSESGARALVDAAFGAPVEPGLADTILARTSGNPFFIEEVARGLRESGVLVDQHGRVVARPGWTPRVPATVQEVLEARLDRLSPAAKRALCIAAVCGRVVRRTILHYLLPENADSLTALERERIVSPQPAQLEPLYVFQHALIQEVAYNRQLQSQRRATHAAVGEAIETIYADRLDEMVGDLAFHYGRSDRDDKAVMWLVKAGDRARSLYANEEALAQYRAALARAMDGTGPYDTAAILERMADVEKLVKGAHAAPPPARPVERVYRKWLGTRGRIGQALCVGQRRVAGARRDRAGPRRAAGGVPA